MKTITFQYHEGKDGDGIIRSSIDMIEGANIIRLVGMESRQPLLKEIAEILNSEGEIIIIRPWFLTDMQKANILNACLQVGYTEIIPIGTSEHASYYMRKKKEEDKS